MRYIRTVLLFGTLCTLSFVCGFVGLAHAQPPTIRAVEKLIVVDANGKKVAPVVQDFSGLQQILLQVKGFLPFDLTVFSERLTGVTNLLFTTNDCSGQAFVEHNLAVGIFVELPAAATGLPGNTIYIPDPNSTPTMVTYNSHRDDQNSQCINDGPTEDTLVPAIPVIDLETIFTPPYHLEAK